MEWIHGGVWRVEGRWWAVLEPYEAPPRRESPLSVREAFEETRNLLPAINFLRDPDHWAKVIGAPAGLHRRTLTRGTVSRVLDAYRSLGTKGTYTDGYREEEWTDDENDELRRLLSEWGPLRPVRGVVAPIPRFGPMAQFRAVYLPTFRGDIEGIIEGAILAESAQTVPVSGRRPFAEQLFGLAEDSLLEVFPRPHLVEGVVAYEVAAGSLRAEIWMWLFSSIGRSPSSTCQFCGRPFTHSASRGRPPSYCPEHRTSAYRREVSRRPRFKQIGESNEW